MKIVVPLSSHLACKQSKASFVFFFFFSSYKLYFVILILGILGYLFLENFPGKILPMNQTKECEWCVCMY